MPVPKYFSLYIHFRNMWKEYLITEVQEPSVYVRVFRESAIDVIFIQWLTLTLIV